MPIKNKKRMVCLANSWKPNGRCIAVKEIIGDHLGSWIRPVSSREGGALSAIERCYIGGREPAVGDVFTANFLGLSRHDYQAENVLIDDQERWFFENNVSFDQLTTCIDFHEGIIWGSGNSSGRGLNDRVSLSVAPRLRESLKLIRIQKLIIKIQNEEWEGKTRRRFRGEFLFNGASYILGITDPKIGLRYRWHADGAYEEDDVLVCLSLSEPLNGYAYKLIASVITKGV